MSVTLFQAVLLSIWGLITGTDRMSEAFFWFRPIIVATGAGIILGDPVHGAMVGGLTELAFAGLTPAGGAIPPDPVIAGMMGAIFACGAGVNPAAAVGLALPFSVLMQYVLVLLYTGYAFFMKPLDRMIDKCDVKGIIRLNIFGLFLAGVVYMVFTFLASYLMQDAISALIRIIPEGFMNGLEVAGGVMPALGFGMLLTTMFKVKYTPFIVIGFLAATYGGFNNILPVALIGAAFAMYNYFFKKEDTVSAVMENGGGEDEGI